MMSKSYKTIKSLLAVMFCIMVSACATMEGVGEDVEHAGEEIQEEANN